MGHLLTAIIGLSIGVIIAQLEKTYYKRKIYRIEKNNKEVLKYLYSQIFYYKDTLKELTKVNN